MREWHASDIEMIYGSIIPADWRTATVRGEAAESVFDSPAIRLFFYGVLYNRDVLLYGAAMSNAELATRLYLVDSEHGFSRLDGSFTIVYFTDRECGVVRDHHGTHCSIYYDEDGSFSTSCVRLAVEDGEVTCDRRSLSHFLQHGLLTVGRTPFIGICALEAGQVLYARTGGEVKCRSYFAPLSSPLPLTTLSEYATHYMHLHEQAIRRRIGNSSHVGILLSGGYDSGSNLVALRSIYDGKVSSYSIGFRGDAWSELPRARLMSKTFGTSHHEYEIDGTEIACLPEIIRYLEVPFVEGGLMVNYCAMRLVGANKPDVILGGDGSDQYFGTSGREVALHYLTSHAGLHPLMRLGINLLQRRPFERIAVCYRVSYHLDRIIHLLEGERFGFSDTALRSFLRHPYHDYCAPLIPQADISSFTNLYNQHAQLSDLETIINRIILFKASRMARLYDNNLAFPFMDLSLYNFLQHLPVEYKCKGDTALNIARGRFVSKYLLKYCYKPKLPEAIASQKKQGGFAPMSLFFDDKSRRDRFKEFILSSSIYDDYLNRKKVERFLREYDKVAGDASVWFWYRQNHAIQYFNLLTLVTWWEEFIEQRTVSY